MFCLKTDQWFRQKDRSSIEPAPQLLERLLGVRYERRDVSTEDEFKFFLDSYFVRGYKTHPILYLGFHSWYADEGADAFVQLRDGTVVTLGQIEGWINGRCGGRLIYFGSCGVMDSHGNRLNRFVRRTNALGVCGLVVCAGHNHASSLCSSRRITLPVLVLGRSSTNCTARGTL